LRSIGVLEGMLRPVPIVRATSKAAPLDADGDHDGDTVSHAVPAPAPAPAPKTTSTAASAPAHPVARSTASSSGGYVIPSYIVQCESGGNWHAVNPSSGAGGAYQIMPSTWQSY